MEPRVKERLIGAAILVGLIVILVPEMLSGPHETEVAPPDTGGGPLQTYTIDLTNPGSQPRELDPAPKQEQQLSLDPDPAARKEDKPEPPSTAQESPPPQKSASPPPAPSSATAPPKQADPPPAAPPPASSKKPPVGGWAVQLGSFAKADNARRLVSELTAKGYDAFTVTSGSGASTRYKVRVPQESRADADRLVARLKKEGRQAAVVANK